MNLVDALRSAFGLAIVLTIIWAIVWLLKRYGGNLVPQRNPSAENQMEILETLSLPPRHKLVRVRNGSDEHLLLLGPAGDLQITKSETAP